MKAVVIGGSGQVGGWLLRGLAARGHEALGTYATTAYEGLTRLDAADLEGAADWVRAVGPDVVFYPAGFTWVDGCEREPARAYAANLEQPLNVARACPGARFVYFSTDYVFDGVAGPYEAGDATNPLSAYGRAKRDAEGALREELGDRALVLRTAWVYGPERQGKNFAYQLVRALGQGKALACPSDQISSPSYGPDVAREAVRLAEAGRSGIVHVAGPEVMDRVTFARGIARAFGLDEGLIEPRTTAELGQGAPRPLRGGLVPGAGVALRPMAEALGDFREAAETGAFAALG